MAETVFPNPHTQLAGREMPLMVSRVFGDLRGRINGDLFAICYGADGLIQTVEEGGVLKRWDPQTGHFRDATALSDLESCWAFNSDGSRVAAGSKNLSVWDVDSGRLLGELDGPAWMLSLAFSPDGNVIATGHDDRVVRLWDTRTGLLITSLEHHRDEVCALAFSHDGCKLASAGEDRLVAVWDLASKKLIRDLKGHTDRIDALAWSFGSNRLASAGWDTSVRVWSTDDGELLAMLNGQGECVHSVVFSPDDDLLVCGDSECVVRLWDFGRLEVLAEMRWHRGPVKHIAMRPDGGQIATGGSDRCIQFWRLPKGEPIIDHEAPLTQVDSVRIADSSELAVVHQDGRLVGWNTANGEMLPVERLTSPIAAIAVFDDGRCAFGLRDGQVGLKANVSDTPQLYWQAHPSSVRLVAFDREGKRLATSAGTDGTINLWDAGTGEAILIIPQAVEQGAVEAIAFHPREDWLAAAGINWLSNGESEGVVAVWDFARREVRYRFDAGATSLAFSPDGRLLAVASLEDSVMIWDVTKGVLVRELAGDESPVNAVAFDPHGRYLAAGSDDCNVRFWESQSWRMLASWDLETSVKDLAFCADGQALITGNGNSTCYWIDLENLPSIR